MRRRILSLATVLAIGTTLALAAASSATAQTKPPRARITVVIKSPAAAPTTATTAKPAPAAPGEPVLRKPLRSTADAAPLADQTPLGQSLALLAASGPNVKGGVVPLRGLNPRSGSAEAGQCRAQCAEARYICSARDAGDCDTAWGQCVVRCSGANYTRTPDLALSSAYRPMP